MRFTFVGSGGSARIDIDAPVDRATTAAEVAEAVAPLVGTSDGLYVGENPLAGAVPVIAAGLRRGALVTLGPSRSRGTPGPQPAHAIIELRVTGGPAAGHVFALGPGTHAVGRDPDTSCSVSDVELSRRHFEVTVGQNAMVTLRDGHGGSPSTNGTFVDGIRIGPEGADVGPGTFVRAGASAFSVAGITAADASVSPGPDGEIWFNRTFRHTTPSVSPVQLALPSKVVAAPQKRPISWAVSLIPAALGVVMALVMRRPEFLLFALMSPAMMLASAWSERRQSRRETHSSAAKAAEARADAMSKLRETLHVQTSQSRAAAPDLAALTVAATGPTTALWQRLPTDDDMLVLRVGLASLPSQIDLRQDGPDRIDQPLLRDVPVTAALADVGVLGVAADVARSQGMLRSLVVQLATLHAPTDLVLSLCVLGGDRTSWDWFCWLPHAAGDGGCARIAVTEESIVAELRTLAALVDQRLDTSTAGFSKQLPLPYVVVVLDGIATLRQVPELVRILQNGPRVGVFVICADRSAAMLPPEAGAALVFTADSQDPTASFTVRGSQAVDEVVTDLADATVADTVARSLAPFRVHDISLSPSAAVPAVARLSELVLGGDISSDAILRCWANGPTRRVEIGATGTGPLSVELGDATPHALVGGSPGSGKTELVRSWLVSLALHNRPEDLSFTIVDFKGGGDWVALADLDHCVGVTTNLEAAGADRWFLDRIVVSLHAEMEKRQRVATAAGAKDIFQYRQITAGDVAAAPMPWLVIVLDEFAAFAEAHPDLLESLVLIAQQGRSHGMHMILAAQDPGRAVTGDIRKNVSLRIVMRVSEASISEAIIGTPDAAAIEDSLVGRGYYRVGEAGPLTLFQGAATSLPLPGQRSTGPLSAVAIPWEHWNRAPQATGAAIASDGPAELALMVRAIAEASQASGSVVPPPPWAQPLPGVLDLETITQPSAGAVPVVAVALGDYPLSQRLQPITLSPGTENWAIAGSGQCGRTTALTTIAGAVAGHCNPADVHVHALDFGSGALRSVAALPNCGTYVDGRDLAHVERMLTVLAAEVRERQGLLNRAGARGFTEWRTQAPDAARAGVVVLVDRLDLANQTLASVSQGAMRDRLVSLLSDGPTVGVAFVCTGDRSILQMPFNQLWHRRFGLSFNDVNDYHYLDLPPRNVPGRLVPGRAVFLDGSAVHLAQFAVLGEDPSGVAQDRALAAIASIAPGPKGASSGPVCVRTLPAVLGIDELGGSVPDDGSLSVLVGVGGDAIEPLRVDLETTPTFVVAGPSHSGRSQALATITCQLVDAGVPVTIVAPKKTSPLVTLGQTLGITVLTGADARDPQILEGVVVVDDVDQVDSQPGTLLPLAQNPEPGRAIVAAGNTEALRNAFGGLMSALARRQCGLLLQPSGPFDGAVFGRPGLSSDAIPGRGYLAIDGDLSLCQVAITKWAQEG